MWTPLPATAPRRSLLSNTPAFGWKTRLAALALGALSALPAAAQLNYPTATQVTGTTPGFFRTVQVWTPLGAGATTLTMANQDDANSAEVALGFNFPYIGGSLNRVIVNTNGYVKVGTAGMAAPTEFLYGSNPQSANLGFHNATAPQNVNLIGPFGHDLDGAGASTTYKIFASADSAVIEWKNVHDYNYNGVIYAPAPTDTRGQTLYNPISFQLKLYPSGVVKFAYGPTTPNAASADNFKVSSAGLKGLSTDATQLLVVTKGSVIAWNLAAAATSTAGNNLNFRKSPNPTTGLPVPNPGVPGQVLAREFRMTPSVGSTFDDRSVIVYTLGSLPLNGGVPHIVRARLNNRTNAAFAGGGLASLSIVGVNPAGPLTVAIPAIPAGGSVVVSFASYTPTVVGNSTLTVTIPTDNVVSNNTSAFAQAVTNYSYSFATAAPAAGGVGFNAAAANFRGEFVARFTATTTQSLNQARVDFQGLSADPADGQDPYQLIVLNAAGPGGTPGAVIFASSVLLNPTTASTAIIPILPVVSVTGDFFIGVRQIGPNNVGFSYESEAPVRDLTFYYRSSNTGNPVTPFLDFQQAGSPFRFSIAADLQDPSPAAPNCPVLNTPLNAATNVPVNGQIAFSSGGGNPTGFDVYLGTNMANVTNNTIGTRVSTNQPGITYNFAPALAFNTVYYYKIIATNTGGQSGGAGVSSCATRSFTTAPAPPANDNCASAQGLTVLPNGTCGGGTPGTTAGATEDAIADPTCSNGIINDVWYVINPGAGSSVLFQLSLGTATSLGAQLFTTCGGAPISCFPNATTPGFSFLGLTPNTNYRVRVFTNTTLASPGTFTVCASQPPNLVVTTAISTLGAYNNVTINAGGTLTMTANLSAANLTINNGGTLVTGGFTASGGSFILNAGGTLDAGSSDGITQRNTPSAPVGSIQFTALRSYSNDATYRFTPATPGFTGAGLPSVVRGIGTGNTAFVTLTSPVQVRELVSLGNADLAVGSSTPPRLTLLSNPVNTAMVNNTGTGVVFGRSRAQRYLATNLNPGIGYRHLTAPVTNTTIGDLNVAGGMYNVIVNPAFNTPATRAVLTLANFPNVFRYNDATAVTRGEFIEGYESPLVQTDAMTSGRGYAVSTRPVTFDFDGTLKNGNAIIPVSNGGATPDPIGSGWNLIGNAYPAPIDWDLVPAASLTAAGLSSAIYVHKSIDATSTNYATYTNGVGPTGTELLAMGQGFFVRKLAAGSSNFTLTNVARLTIPTNPLLNRRVETRPLLALNLLQAGQLAKLSDNAYVYFEQGATTDGNDARYDAQKLSSTGSIPTLYTKALATRMGINGLPALDGSNVIVPLVADVTITGVYTLNADQLVNFPAGTDVLLVDALTGTTQNLRTNPSYSFRATAGNSTPRFTLQFRGNGVTGVNADVALANQLDVYPNPTNGEALHVAIGGLTAEHAVTVTLVNSLGQVVTNQQVPVTNAAMSTELNVSKLARGFYTLRVVANGRSATRTVVVK